VINEVDEALRRLLIQELPIKNNEVELNFNQPKREVTSRWNKPTINCYLHDVRQNKLRQKQWEVTNRNGNDSVALKRTPLRFDLHYIITIWTEEPDDEHYLLTRTILALCRYAYLPKEFLPESLQAQPNPIPMLIAEPEEFLNPSDLWSSLDNELRPSLSCVISIALNPFVAIETPLVKGFEVKLVSQSASQSIS